MPTSSLEQLEPTFALSAFGGTIACTMGAAGTGATHGISGPRAMGMAIRALRKRMGLSQVQLGARIGMHHNYLGPIERGAVPNPGLETVERIAAGLDVSIAALAERYARPATSGAPTPSARLESSSRAEAGPLALGEAIRLLRQRRQLTQSRLADVAHIHRGHLASIEAGERSSPGIGTIAAIACGLEAGAEAAPLLPLLAQTFTGELSIASLRATLERSPSGSSDLPLPQAGAIS